jgi:hypothetical protein
MPWHHDENGINATPKLGRRKGFGVKLAGHHVECIHVSYVWMVHRCLNNPDVDQAVKLLPPVGEAGQSNTLRVRGADVKGMIELLHFTGTLNWSGAPTFHKRANALARIDAHDLLADAGR